jgi:hypothetical protein
VVAGVALSGAAGRVALGCAPAGNGISPEVIAGAGVATVGASGSDVTGATSFLLSLIRSNATPLWPLSMANVRLVMKNSDANMAVERDRKEAAPCAPKTDPDAPEPKEAPASAPLPCCMSIRPMMPTLNKTWITMII